MTKRKHGAPGGRPYADAGAERRDLRAWYGRGLGRALLEEECRELERILPNLFGYHLLQVGCAADADLLATSRIRHRAVVDLSADGLRPAGTPGALGLYGRPEALPVQGDCIDVVLLPHTLEFAHDPHEVLREVDRVLVPEGHAVILGFNPWSLWGMWRALRSRWRGASAPWCGRFRGVMRIKDWLALLGFDTVVTRCYFFRPPLRRAGVMKRLRFLDWAGRRWWSYLGGGYLVVAKKRVATLTPIRPHWQPRRGLIKADIANPTT